MRKHQDKVLKDLYSTIESRFIGRDTIFLIDNYESGDNSYGGVLWVENHFMFYKYDLNNKRVDFVRVPTSTEDYPRNGIVTKALVLYLEELKGEEIDYSSFPASGRSNNGYCLFTIIVPKNKYTKSYAFRQW